MEWKKEKISAAELERSRQEYMSAAMRMMKRTASAAPEPVVQPEEPAAIAAPVQEPETAPAEPTEAFEDMQTTETAQVGITAKVEITAQAKETAQPKEPAQPEETAQPEEPEKPENERFGVFTADELLSAKNDDSGLKKAAEILEEMTRNTAIMKKLASDADEDEDPDTTDFPRFSCDTDGEDCSFRDEYGTDSASAAISETEENE